ncbi:hypothetical protein P7C73_g1968, partial [Tremellales sp. Uapishka_1]
MRSAHLSSLLPLFLLTSTKAAPHQRACSAKSANSTVADGTGAADFAPGNWAMPSLDHKHQKGSSSVFVASTIVSSQAIVPTSTLLSSPATSPSTGASSDAAIFSSDGVSTSSANVPASDAVPSPSNTATSSAVSISSSSTAVVAASDTIISTSNIAATSVVPSTTLITPSSSSAADTTVSSATATAMASSGGGGSGGAIGVGWNADSGSQMSSFTNLSWYYNWGYTPSSNTDSSIEYVPQVWGSGSVDGVAAAESSWPSGTNYILSFNEPDQGGQSNLEASVAATLHQKWTANITGSYKIGTPAVARGGKTWLSDWVAACDGRCTYDFVPLHFYGTVAADLVTYVEDFYSIFNRPVWVTEFACHDYDTGAVCTESEVKAFQKTAISAFRSSGHVERWAWFGAFTNEASGGDPNGIEGNDGSPNTAGDNYLAL